MLGSVPWPRPEPAGAYIQKDKLAQNSGQWHNGSALDCSGVFFLFNCCLFSPLLEWRGWGRWCFAPSNCRIDLGLTTGKCLLLLAQSGLPCLLSCFSLLASKQGGCDSSTAGWQA